MWASVIMYNLEQVAYLFTKLLNSADKTSCVVIVLFKHNYFHLVQYVKDSHPQAKAHESFQFKFINEDNYLELVFNKEQDKSLSGWIVKPHDSPMRV